MTEIRPGDVVYLVPGRLTAPRIAYKQPKVRVVSIKQQVDLAAVELPDGKQIETHPGNLALRRQPKPRTPKPPPRPAIDPEHGEEVPLW